MKLAVFLILFSLLGTSSYSKESIGVVVNLEVTENGFQPNKIDITPDTPVTLKITRKTDNTCSTSIQIPSKKIKKELPLNKTVEIDLGKLSKGEIRFGCGMNMMDSGKIYVK